VGFNINKYPNLTAFQEDVAEKYDETYGEIVIESMAHANRAFQSELDLAISCGRLAQNLISV
jgi:hypothetical protein